MDWDRLRIFEVVATAGGFTKASDVLNISQSALSRHIALLETELGIVLFTRIPRGLELTSQGQMLLNTVRDIMHSLADTEQEMQHNKGQVEGMIRFSCSYTFGIKWMIPVLADFMNLYPRIRIALNLTPDNKEFAFRESDISCTRALAYHPDILHTEPIIYASRLYASKDYLAKHGEPQTLADLSSHALIGEGVDFSLHSIKNNWHLKTDAKGHKWRKPYVVANQCQAIIEMARLGVGIAHLSKYMVADQDNLVEVLPNVPKPLIQRYLVYPKQLEQFKRIQTLKDFLFERMKQSDL